ncbi:MAG: hypothetical protein CW335_03990 [Clostridiales bacterium]|nr:hypothetical protein [Clostridiales bacterium]
MGNLKRNANRFLFKHRNKGIPNLLLYISIGNLVVYVISLIMGFKGVNVSALLDFDAASILSGQVWRLFTFPFTYIFDYSYLFFKVIALYFYYWIGKVLENNWGTLKLNLFYFCGLLLMDIAGVLLYVFAGLPVLISASYINMSLFLAVATLIPEQRVLLFMIIPIKMRWMALVDIALTVYSIIRSVSVFSVLGGSMVWYALIVFGTAPLISLINYLLFFGRDVKNLFGSRRIYQKRPKKPKPEAAPNPDWAKNYRSASGEKPYRHKCTVCGRTDTDCPDLEFRYCSKCAGYFCYCIDHINNHTHIQ